jgi:hypothetical protein
MTENYEQRKARCRERAREILELVESGEAIRLQRFWLMFTSGVESPFLFKPSEFDSLCDLLGSNASNAAKFMNFPGLGYDGHPLPVWLRADTMCSIRADNRCHYYLVDGMSEFVDRDDLPDREKERG